MQLFFNIVLVLIGLAALAAKVAAVRLERVRLREMREHNLREVLQARQRQAATSAQLRSLADVAPLTSAPSEGYYGADRAVHRTKQLNIETHKGKIVSVWFRCMGLPFDVTEVDELRAKEMASMYENREGEIPEIDGVGIRRRKVR